MHSFDSYHSRWFPLWCLWGLSIFLLVALIPPGTMLPTALRAGLTGGTALMMIWGSLLLREESDVNPQVRAARRWTLLISILGFGMTAAGSLIATGYTRALMTAAGMGVLLVLPPPVNSRLLPDTGEPAGEWLAGALIAAGLSANVRHVPAFLAGIAGISALRFFFGMVFRIVPVRVARPRIETILHRVSWIPAAAAVVAAGLTMKDSPLLRFLVWAALSVRAAYHLVDGFRRLAVLARLVPRGHRRGMFRSFLIYHRIPFRAAATKRFYLPFAAAGGRAWDVGAHLGNRCRSWLNLGLNVTAFEPQPACADLLELWFGTSLRFHLQRSAAGAERGEAVLRVSGRHPTLASVSTDWVERMGRHPAFNGILWSETITVPVVPLREFETFDGPPDILKVDVEGFEAAVLAGTDPLPAMLSFEVLPTDKENALRCIELLTSRHRWRWNLVFKERFRFHFPAPVPTPTLVEAITGMADTHPSGDIYGWKLE